jgi:hypothetical protein
MGVRADGYCAMTLRFYRTAPSREDVETIEAAGVHALELRNCKDRSVAQSSSGLVYIPCKQYAYVSQTRPARLCSTDILDLQQH